MSCEFLSIAFTLPMNRLSFRNESPLLCEESAFRSSSNDRCHKYDKYDNCVLIKVKIFYIYNVIIIRCVKFDKKCLTLHIIMYTLIKAVHVDMGANLFD